MKWPPVSSRPPDRLLDLEDLNLPAWRKPPAVMDRLPARAPEHYVHPGKRWE